MNVNKYVYDTYSPKPVYVSLLSNVREGIVLILQTAGTLYFSKAKERGGVNEGRNAYHTICDGGERKDEDEISFGYS